MSKGSARRPESEPGNYARGFDMIKQNQPDDMCLFYLFHIEAGNYPITEAVQRWWQMSPESKEAILRQWKARQDDENPHLT